MANPDDTELLLEIFAIIIFIIVLCDGSNASLDFIVLARLRLSVQNTENY